MSIEIVQLTIAVCKEEVGKVPGILETIELHDEGSPWGRAALRMMGLLREIKNQETSEAGPQE